MVRSRYQPVRRGCRLIDLCAILAVVRQLMMKSIGTTDGDRASSAQPGETRKVLRQPIPPFG